MDSSGGMHVPAELKATLEKAYGKPVDVTTGPPPAGSLLIESEEIARELAVMNRAARLIFRSERRRGASEEAALETAKNSLPR